MNGMTTLAPSINFPVDGYGFLLVSVGVCLVEKTVLGCDCLVGLCEGDQTQFWIWLFVGFCWGLSC